MPLATSDVHLPVCMEMRRLRDTDYMEEREPPLGPPHLTPHLPPHLPPNLPSLVPPVPPLPALATTRRRPSSEPKSGPLTGK